MFGEDFSDLGFSDFSAELTEFEIKKIRKWDRVWKISEGGSIGVSPLFYEGRLYFGSMDHNIYSVDSDTGKEVWRFRTGGSIFCYRPVFHNRNVYFGSYDCYLYCIRSEDGKFIWRFATSSLVQSRLPPVDEAFEVVVKSVVQEDEKQKKDESYQEKAVDLAEEVYSIKSEYSFKSEYQTKTEYR